MSISLLVPLLPLLSLVSTHPPSLLAALPPPSSLPHVGTGSSSARFPLWLAMDNEKKDATSSVPRPADRQCQRPPCYGLQYKPLPSSPTVVHTSQPTISSPAQWC
ncbi:hypothetical protein BRADI_2g21951v3 [Brachypodium distachyon]|uniref:Secreted protein n=1 Tax=Brachypodium distachyon TaxID=15368 RepID=A0A0Q3MNF8_BRADI|nr:hypothetical protein BRADI_2g21951v3 [Brachypodium distachyon]PNT71030.1 hypothetical protein BRADI_2g21951v3 [Brachypodium distachyon]